MYKPLADSTLQRMKKTEIIELLRIAEHNAKVAQEYVDQQAKNLKDWAPVRHGRWITTSGEVFPGSSQFLCYSHKHDECGFQYVGMYDNEYDYCPKCGAKMDVGNVV